MSFVISRKKTRSETSYWTNWRNCIICYTESNQIEAKKCKVICSRNKMFRYFRFETQIRCDISLQVKVIVNLISNIVFAWFCLVLHSFVFLSLAVQEGFLKVMFSSSNLNYLLTLMTNVFSLAQLVSNLNLTGSEFSSLYSWYSWPNVVLPVAGGHLVDR